MADFLTRQGLRLCSHRDPRGEAEAWVRANQGTETENLFVLGIGDGFHLRALQEEYPKLKITAFDFDSQTLISVPKGVSSFILQSQFDSNEVFHSFIHPSVYSGFRVLSFRASWAGLESAFQRLERFLLGRHGECNPFLASDLGLKKAFFAVADDTEVNIRSVTADESASGGLSVSLRWRRLRALRELVS